MDLGGSQHEREVLAGRNQARFRAVNERMRELNTTFASITDLFEIVCECADPGCTEAVSIRPFDYFAIRGNPRRFAVLPGHDYSDVERVVEETESYMVVETVRAAAAVAEGRDPARS